MMASTDAVTSSNGNGSVRLPVFPTEEPNVDEVINYLDASEPLVNATHSFELRGKTPPALLHLDVTDDMTGFTLITGTEALTATGMKHNFSVRQAQLRNSKRKVNTD